MATIYTITSVFAETFHTDMNAQAVSNWLPIAEKSIKKDSTLQLIREYCLISSFSRISHLSALAWTATACWPGSRARRSVIRARLSQDACRGLKQQVLPIKEFLFTVAEAAQSAVLESC